MRVKRLIAEKEECESVSHLDERTIGIKSR